MPRPFVAYLRVYEPLSALPDAVAPRVRRAIDAGPLSRGRVGERERELWLRSQLASPARLLPGELADGRPNRQVALDALVLDPAERPDGDAADGSEGTGEATDSAGDDAGNDTDSTGEDTGDTAGDTDDPLVCPLDLRPRAATALLGFLAETVGPLADEAVSVPQDSARSRASAVLAEQPGVTMHSISATWTVPLPWFVIVAPGERRLVLAPLDDPERSASWRTPVELARQRVARAYAVVSKGIGEEGPARTLRETGRWLEQFHPAAVVELDYGGLVQLLDDDTLLADTTAADVHAIVDALELGDAEQVAERYERLRDFWAAPASRERYG